MYSSSRAGSAIEFLGVERLFHKIDEFGRFANDEIGGDGVKTLSNRFDCHSTAPPSGEYILDEMRRAAGHLTGEHDFRAFTVTASEAESSVRTIERLEILEEENGLGIYVA